MYIGWAEVRSRRVYLLVSILVALSILVAVGTTSLPDDLVSSAIIVIHGRTGLDMLVISLSFLGDTSTLLLLAVALTIIKRTRRAGVVFLTCILILVILSMYIKMLVGRDTPSINSPSVTALDPLIEEETISPLANNLSYPASQIAIVTCFAYIVELKFLNKSRFAPYLMFSYVFLMAFSRLYLLQYYLTDIIGGFLLGLVIGIVMSSIMRLRT